MFKIRNVATTGFDRAIIAMRRENGGREASDSEWKEVHGLFDMTGIREFVIGPEDKEECERLIKLGNRDFMQLIGVWAHIEAPVKWWNKREWAFVGKSDVERKGDTLTRSVFTTYSRLRDIVEIAHENREDWRECDALCEVLEDLPESWMIIPKTEKMEG